MTCIRVIGFTGSRDGLSVRQYNRLRVAFKRLLPQEPTEFHHGDCQGADEDIHGLVREMFPRCTIVIHPPDNPARRAFCKGDVILEPKPYLQRDWDLVNASTYLLAAPKSMTEERRSGTWATIRYARTKGMFVHIFYPDGTSRTEFNDTRFTKGVARAGTD